MHIHYIVHSNRISTSQSQLDLMEQCTLNKRSVHEWSTVKKPLVNCLLWKSFWKWVFWMIVLLLFYLCIFDSLIRHAYIPQRSSSLFYWSKCACNQMNRGFFSLFHDKRTKQNDEQTEKSSVLFCFFFQAATWFPINRFDIDTHIYICVCGCNI